MKNLTKMALLGSVLASSAWSAPVALTASDGVTNHPVLFVHGINSSMGAWGASSAESDILLECEEALKNGDYATNFNELEVTPPTGQGGSAMFELWGGYDIVINCSSKPTYQFEKAKLTDLGATTGRCSIAGKGQDVTVENSRTITSSPHVVVADVFYTCVDSKGDPTGLLGNDGSPIVMARVNFNPILAALQDDVAGRLTESTDYTGTLKDSHIPGKFVKYLGLKNGDEDSYNEVPQGGAVDFFKLRKGSNGSGLYFYNSRKVTNFDEYENRETKSACNPELKQLHTSLNPNQFDAGGSTNSSGSINFNNISFKSTLQCGAITSNKFDRPTFVGNSQNNLNACLRRENCSIKSSSVDSRTWLAEITFDDNSILVADFSALKAPFSNEFNTTRLKNLSLAKNKVAPAPWQDIHGTPGQSQLLLERIYEVLDDYYGQGMWVGNSDARIDIVTHSQGGLITRDMLNNMQSNTSVTNPINYINQIVNMDTPHFGAVLPTAPDKLRDPNPLHGRIYPKAGVLLNQFVYGANGGLDMGQTTSSLGAEVKWSLEGNLFDGAEFYYRVKALGFTLKSEKEEVLEEGTELTALLKAAQPMAWGAQWIADVNSYEYPVKPLTNEKIAMTNLSTGSDGNFYRSMIENAVAKVKEDCESRDGDIEQSVCNGIAYQVLNHSKTKLLLNQADEAMEEFVKNSDLAVETPSQEGFLNDQSFVDAKAANVFKVKSYKRSPLTRAHLDIANPFDGPAYIKTSVTREGCDVFEILTNANSDYTLNGCGKLGRQIAGIKTAYKPKLGAPVTEGVEIESIVLQPYAETQALPPMVEYYVQAEPIHGPQVSLVSGNVTGLSLTQVKGTLYKASYEANDLEAVNLGFGYEDGTSWDYSNDPSLPLGTALSVNHKITFTNSDGYKGGVEPDLYEQKWEADLYELEVRGIERSPYSTVSKPRLKLKNTGSEVVDNVVIRYFVRSADSVVLDVFSFAGQDKGEIRLENYGEGLYSVTIMYNNLGLVQGQELSWIDFELHHPWSTSQEWDTSDDPSQVDGTMKLIDVQVINSGQSFALPSELK